MKNYFKILFEHIFKLYGYFVCNTKEAQKYINNNIILPPNYYFKILDSTNANLFDNPYIPQPYRENYIHRLLDTNYKCFAVIHESSNTLAYYSWINQHNNYYVKEINQYKDFQKNNAVLFEGDVTLPEHQNKGIHTYVFNQRIKYSIQNNIDQIFIAIYLKNKPAIKTIQKYPFKRFNINPVYLRKSIK